VASAALLNLCAEVQANDDSLGVKLLNDIKRTFYPVDTDGRALPAGERVASLELAKSLGEMEDRPWAEWGKTQKPISQPQLARLLSRYGIGPRNIRFLDGRVLRGYEREQFDEAWALYLPPDAPTTPLSRCYSATTVMNTDKTGSFGVTTKQSCSAPKNATLLSKDAPCSSVAVQKSSYRGQEAETVSKPAFEEGQV
jgi:hypothetical protein